MKTRIITFVLILITILLTASISSAQEEYSGPLGHGTGYYTKTADSTAHKYYFTWKSYTNSDGYIQIEMDVAIKQSDANVIKKFRDQMNRDGVWDATVTPTNSTTWIGTSNDIFCLDRLSKKYFHLGKEQKVAGGGTTAPLIFHYRTLKRDYLERISRALNNRLIFYVAELGETKG
ncbi:MAG: hypothetical protein WC453_02790 [Patescibacteria group bacterium]